MPLCPALRWLCLYISACLYLCGWGAEVPDLLTISRYKDKAALAAHAQTEYFKVMGKTIKQEDLLEKPMEVVFTREAGGFASKL